MLHLSKRRIISERNSPKRLAQKLCWFGAQSKLKIVSRNFQQMEIFSQVDKITKFSKILFFTSGGGVDDVVNN